MSYKRKKQIKALIVTALNISLPLSLSACSNVPIANSTESIESIELQAILPQQNAESEFQYNQKTAEQIAVICGSLFEKIENTSADSTEKSSTEHAQWDYTSAPLAADLELLRSIINLLGAHRYTAIDTKNQINMTNSESAVRFCESAAAKTEDALTIIAVGYSGDFIIYDLKTKDGKTDITKGLYRYSNGALESFTQSLFTADYLCYTPDGYLLFSGTGYSQELYVLSLSGSEEYAALRVQPLDEPCRVLNRKYILTVGYEYNNLFLTNWSEDNYGELDFYDAFDHFYPLEHPHPFPYIMAEDLGVGAVYRIPKAEFEAVIQRRFAIDSPTLQSKTIYHAENETYEYRPRGFYEIEFPSGIYPEVTAFTEQCDGTIALHVQAVYPEHGLSCAFSHEVVVRLLEDGGVQYVSNRVLSPETPYEPAWHTPRLTEAEWTRIYEKGELK